jgi:protein-tyrosine kinase
LSTDWRTRFDRFLPAPRVVHDADARPGEAVNGQAPRAIDVDPVALERERILPPGASGPHGAPYKMLRTQVLLRLDKLKARSLAIVGNEPGSGKTLTAINLAIAVCADPDRSALLVDLDLHKPDIHRRLGFEPAAGVDDYLRQERSLSEALVRLTGYERLQVLPARERCLDSSELLGGVRTHELIREIRQRDSERLLIFDLPPVLKTDDALAFSRHVEAALIVVGEGRTQRRDLVRTLELLRELPVVGTVLNATREVVDAYY